MVKQAYPVGTKVLVTIMAILVGTFVGLVVSAQTMSYNNRIMITELKTSQQYLIKTLDELKKCVSDIRELMRTYGGDLDGTR